VHFSAGPAAEYEAFLAQLAAEPGAVRTRSGLVYRDLAPGSGAAPRESDTIAVRFQTKTLGGRVVEDSTAYGGAVTVALDQVAPCMREAVLRMKAGGVSRFACPLPVNTDCARCPADVPAPLAVEATLVGVGQALPAPGH
jgi:FKBP-type peptidyl-prolyl cis-trans isomerase